MNDEKYITIIELAELKGVITRAIRLSKGKYQTKDVVVKDGKSFKILLSSIEPDCRKNIIQNLFRFRLKNNFLHYLISTSQIRLKQLHLQD